MAWKLLVSEDIGKMRGVGCENGIPAFQFELLSSNLGLFLKTRLIGKDRE